MRERWWKCMLWWPIKFFKLFILICLLNLTYFYFCHNLHYFFNYHIYILLIILSHSHVFPFSLKFKCDLIGIWICVCLSLIYFWIFHIMVFFFSWEKIMNNNKAYKLIRILKNEKLNVEKWGNEEKIKYCYCRYLFYCIYLFLYWNSKIAISNFYNL